MINANNLIYIINQHQAPTAAKLTIIPIPTIIKKE